MKFCTNDFGKIYCAEANIWVYAARTCVCVCVECIICLPNRIYLEHFEITKVESLPSDLPFDISAISSSACGSARLELNHRLSISIPLATHRFTSVSNGNYRYNIWAHNATAFAIFYAALGLGMRCGVGEKMGKKDLRVILSFFVNAENANWMV